MEVFVMNKADGKEIRRVWIALGVFAILLVIACIIAFVFASRDTAGHYYIPDSQNSDSEESRVLPDDEGITELEDVLPIEVGDVSGDVIIVIGSDNEVVNGEKSEPDSQNREVEVEIESEPKPEPEPELQSEPEPELELETEFEREPRTEVEPELEAEVELELEPETKPEPELQPEPEAEPAVLVAPCNLRIEVDEPSQSGYLVWESSSLGIDSFRVEVSRDGTFSDLQDLSTVDILPEENRARMSLAAWVESDGLQLRVVAIQGEERAESEVLEVESSDFPLWPFARLNVASSDEGVVFLQGTLFDAEEFRVKRGFGSWDEIEWEPVSSLEASNHFFSYSWQPTGESESRFVFMQFRNEHGMFGVRDFIQF